MRSPIFTFQYDAVPLRGHTVWFEDGSRRSARTSARGKYHTGRWPSSNSSNASVESTTTVSSTTPRIRRGHGSVQTVGGFALAGFIGWPPPPLGLQPREHSLARGRVLNARGK